MAVGTAAAITSLAAMAVSGISSGISAHKAKERRAEERSQLRQSRALAAANKLASQAENDATAKRSEAVTRSMAERANNMKDNANIAGNKTTGAMLASKDATNQQVANSINRAENVKTQNDIAAANRAESEIQSLDSQERKLNEAESAAHLNLGMNLANSALSAASTMLGTDTAKKGEGTAAPQQETELPQQAPLQSADGEDILPDTLPKGEKKLKLGTDANDYYDSYYG